MTRETSATVLRFDEAMARLPGAGGKPFVELLRRGSLLVEAFAPRGVDTQKPHRQDELYVVMRGRAQFVHGTERSPVQPGDLLFVPAGMEHRFEEFSEDFAVWVAFYGPDGGEASATLGR